MRISIIALTAVTLLPLAGSAQNPPPSHATASPGNLPPALKVPLQHGFHVVKSFPAASGLTGWVVRDPNRGYNIFYTTPDGQTLLAGELLTGSGQDLSQQYTEQYVPAPDLRALWSRIQKAAVVVTGTSPSPKSVIYVIMDPNCIYCHMLWIALKPYEAAGLQVRWIPVGFLHEDSAAKAAALLKFGATALNQAQEHFDLQAESGGIAGITITPQLKLELDSNLRLMREAGVEGTPGVFYTNAAGLPTKQDGMPSLTQLPSITGLPAQPERDPQLARFSSGS